MTKRLRSERRAQDRNSEKLTRDLERLALLGPGGEPQRAILVTSPAEVEVQARAMPCPVCRGELRVDDHTAETVKLPSSPSSASASVRVRVAAVSCSQCGRRRRIYFQLRAASLN